MSAELSPTYDVAKDGPGGLLKLVAEEHPSRLIRMAARFDAALGLSNSLYANERKQHFGSESTVDDSTLPKPAPLSWLMRQAMVFDMAASSARDEKARKKYFGGDVYHGDAAEDRAFHTYNETQPGVRAETMLKGVVEASSAVNSILPSFDESKRPAAAERRPTPAMFEVLKVDPILWESLTEKHSPKPKPREINSDFVSKAKSADSWQAVLTTINGISDTPVLRTDPQKFELRELMELRSHLLKGGLKGGQLYQSQSGENKGRWSLAFEKEAGPEATAEMFAKVLTAAAGTLSSDVATSQVASARRAPTQFRSDHA